MYKTNLTKHLIFPIKTEKGCIFTVSIFEKEMQQNSVNKKLVHLLFLMKDLYISVFTCVITHFKSLSRLVVNETNTELLSILIAQKS